MNNKNDSVKIILIIALVIIAGYFLFKTMSNRQAGQAGLVVVGNPVHTEGSPCTLPDGTQGIYDANGNCVYPTPYWWWHFDLDYGWNWWEVDRVGHPQMAVAFTGNTGAGTGTGNFIWGQGSCPTLVLSVGGSCVMVKLPGSMTPLTMDMTMAAKVNQQLNNTGFMTNATLAKQTSPQDMSVLAAMNTLRMAAMSPSSLKTVSVTSGTTTIAK